MNALQINQLTKTYGNGKTALSGIDLAVSDGDFFALLGPNGAGKSTAIGIVSSLVNKTSGSVSIFDHDLDQQRDKCKSFIGLVPQEINFNTFESARHILVTQAGYYGIGRKIASKRADEYLQLLDLWDKRDAIARTMSGGMKRRLMIARALIHQPRLLILDEPTAGVDIEIRRSMWEFLEEINRRGTTIILTTHYLEEAESLCRNVAIIDHGMIIEHGAVQDLLSRSMVQSFVLDLQQPADQCPGLDGYTVTRHDGTRLDIEVPTGSGMTSLFAQLASQGHEVISLRNKSNRLEEFFLRLVDNNKPTEQASAG